MAWPDSTPRMLHYGTCEGRCTFNHLQALASPDSFWSHPMRLPQARQFFAASAAVSALLMTAACGSDAEPATDGTPSATASEPATAGATTGDVADGTYDGSGSYANPGGVSEVHVTMTIAAGKVSDVKVEPGATGTSLQYQQKFISGIAAEVVGKSLDEIKVSKVSGSSLTSQGFNQALDQIKAEATS